MISRNVRENIVENRKTVAGFTGIILLALNALGPVGVVQNAERGFGMGHEPEHSSAGIAKSRDALGRSVGICGVGFGALTFVVAKEQACLAIFNQRFEVGRIFENQAALTMAAWKIKF